MVQAPRKPPLVALVVAPVFALVFAPIIATVVGRCRLLARYWPVIALPLQ
jgi:hypothetical protein